MVEYNSAFIRKLAQRWEIYRPLAKQGIAQVDNIMMRSIINSILDTFNILDRMPEFLESLDHDEPKRLLIEAEVTLLAQAIEEGKETEAETPKVAYVAPPEEQPQEREPEPPLEEWEVSPELATEVEVVEVIEETPPEPTETPPLKPEPQKAPKRKPIRKGGKDNGDAEAGAESGAEVKPEDQ